MQTFADIHGELHGGMWSIVGRVGGKSRLKKTIIDLLPEHTTYVEPFVGGGAVFFGKEPSSREVVNDLDADIYHIYSDMSLHLKLHFTNVDAASVIMSNILFGKTHFSKNRADNVAHPNQSLITSSIISVATSFHILFAFHERRCT